MSSKTQIYNTALSRIGVSKQVANVDTENSREAVQGKLVWDNDVRVTLRAFPWPWATKYRALTLLGGSSADPYNNDWTFAYRYPVDCVFARRLVVEGYGRVNPNPPPFRVGRDTQGRIIYTNQEDAELEYTELIVDPNEFDPLMESALAWKLGASVAPSLSRIQKMADKCLSMFVAECGISQAVALNEGQQEVPLESEFIRSRDS